MLLPGEEGLARGLDEELWAPRFFSMGGMDEGLGEDEGFPREE